MSRVATEHHDPAAAADRLPRRMNVPASDDDPLGASLSREAEGDRLCRERNQGEDSGPHWNPGIASELDSDMLLLSPSRNFPDVEPLELLPGRYTLGAAPECDVTIAAEGVADRHCTLVVGPRKTIVKAWSPLTWINDGAVLEGTLKPGDRLILGPVEFQVRRVPRKKSETAEAAPSRPPIDRLLESFLPPPRPAVPRPRQADVEQAPRPDRREQRVRELLADVQGLLDELLRRERIWEETCTSHRSGLEELESLLYRRNSRLEEERRCVRTELQDLKRQRKRQMEEHSLLRTLRDEVATQERRIGEERTALEELRGQLAERENELVRQQQAESQRGRIADDEASARIEQSQAALGQEREELDRLRDGLRAEETNLAEERDALNRSRLALQEQSDEFEARARELRQKEERFAAAERQSPLERRLQALLAREREVEQRVDELAGRARQLSLANRGLRAERSDVAQARAELVQRREDLVTLSAELDRQRIEADAAAALVERLQEALQEERRTFERAQQELNAERNALVRERTEVEELRSRESDLTRREDSQRRRLEEIEKREAALEAERERGARQEAELERRSQELEAREEDVIERQQNVDLEREAFLAQRQMLIADRLTFEERVEELDRRSAELEEQRHRADQERRNQEAERETLEIDRQSLISERFMLQQQTEALNARRDQLLQQGSGKVSTETTGAQPAGETERQRPPHGETGPESPPDAAPEGDSPVPEEQTDEANRQLNSRLAELFSPLRPPESAPAPKQSTKAERGNSPPDSSEQSGLPDGADAAPLTDFAEQNEQSPDEAGDEPEADVSDDSIAGYMERLLARTRQRSVKRQEAAPSATPGEEAASAVEEPEPPATVASSGLRRLRPEEKEVLRANLDSFRDVANYSARTAVARSHVLRRRAAFRNLSIAAGTGWLATASLWIAGGWLMPSQPPVTFSVGALSLAVSLMALRHLLMLRFPTTLPVPELPGNEAEERIPDEGDRTEEPPTPPPHKPFL